MTITLPPDYRPAEDEEFMNPMQLAYFKRKLEDWRLELLVCRARRTDQPCRRRFRADARQLRRDRRQ